MTPLKAIRAKCLDCSGFQPKEVRICPVTTCPLWLFRLGTNPNRTGLQNAGSFQKHQAHRAKMRGTRGRLAVSHTRMTGTITPDSHQDPVMREHPEEADHSTRCSWRNPPLT